MPIVAAHTKALLLAALLLAMLSTSPAHSAITVEAGNGVAFDSSGLSTSFLVPNLPDRVLIVGFGSISENFIDIVPTSLTFNGTTLTHLGGITQNVFTDWYARTDIYYMINPAAGAGNLDGTVNASRPGGFRQESDWGMYGMVLAGAAQAAPELLFTGLQNPNAPSQTIGGNVSGAAVGDMLVGFTALNGGLNSLFSSSGIVEDFDTATGDLNFGAAHKLVSGDPELFTWTSNGFASGIGTTAIARVLPATTPVPLPPALGLMAAALLPLAARGRRAA